MKTLQKTLISSLILAMFVVPSFSKAQTYATTDDLTTLKAQLISLIQQEIALLQAQLDQILAAQNTPVDGRTVTVPSVSMSQPATVANVAIGGASTNTSVPAQPSVSVSLSPQECYLQPSNHEYDAFFAFNVSGDYDSIVGRVWNTDLRSDGTTQISRSEAVAYQSSHNFGFHGSQDFGVPFSYTLKALDTRGNVLASDSGTVTFTKCN